MLPVTLVYFCYGWTLWLFLTWIPQYFLHNYHMNLKNSAVFASGVFFAGVLGDSLGGHITDWLLMRTGSRTKARSYMVAVCNLAALASLLPILFVHDSTIAAICLEPGFLLRGADDRADVGDSDGYRAEVFRHCQRIHEHGLGAGGDFESRGRRAGSSMSRGTGTGPSSDPWG